MNAGARAALALVVLCLASGCGGSGEEAEEPAAAAPTVVGAEDWEQAWDASTEGLTWTDLPGVEGLEDLEPPARRAVLTLANETSCPCGCATHVLAQCLHEVDGCLTARDTVTDLVAEARRRAAREAALRDGEGGSTDTPGAGSTDPGPPNTEASSDGEEAAGSPNPAREASPESTEPPATTPAPEGEETDER